MKLSETSILLIPGLGNAEESHWLSSWERKFSNARRVPVLAWDKPERDHWVTAIVTAARQAEKSVVIIAHSLGVAALAHAAPHLPKTVRGAWLGALSDWNKPDLIPGVTHDFAPLPREPFAFPSMLIASRNDPYCDYEVAADHANAWGSALIDSGEVGHINVESGHGPWPEGLMRFATFLGRLPA
jgi:predicted alpha/beta hydrolase family esterase